MRTEKTVGGITIDSIGKSENQKANSLTAQLRQVFTTKTFYPSKTVRNNLNGNVFDANEFGYEEQAFTNDDTRVAWIIVPVGITPAQLLERLKKFPDATLYKVLANQPILTDDQRYSISVGQRTLDQYADSQVVRFGKNHEKAGQIIPDKNGNVQYKAVFFSEKAKEKDIIDMRTSEDGKQYVSANIKAELEKGYDVTASVESNSIKVDDLQIVT